MNAEEAKRWEDYVPQAGERCPVCHTCGGLLELWQDAEAEYQRQMDPTQHDGKPDRDVRNRKHGLTLAVQRRRECSERHED